MAAVRDPAPSRAGAGYRADVDGLRAIAIVLVVGFHVGLRGFSGGFSGVDVFFVVSGFLITGLLLSELETGGRVKFADFYARRIRRLLPALSVVIVATLVAGALVLLPWQERQLGKSSIAAAVFGSNFYFWRALHGYFGLVAGDQPLLHTWSLGVEEQFYLLWPAGLAIVWYAARRFGLSRTKTLGTAMAALSAASFLLAVVYVRHDPSAAFYLLPTRLWELGAGGLLAVWRPRPRARIGTGLSFAGIGAVVATGIAVNSTSRWPGVAALPLVLGTAAVIAAGAHSPVNRILATKPFVVVGRLSYSWYLWHFSLLTLVRVDTLHTNKLRDTGVAIAALGLAGLTYVLVEQPIRTQRIRALRPHPMTFALGVALIAVAVLGGLAAAETPRGAIERARSSDYGCLVVLTAAPIKVPSACVPVRGNRGTIVLVGDSHAATLQPAFEDIARRLGLQLEVGTRASCPFMPGLGRQCDPSYAATLRDILRQQTSVRLVVVHYESLVPPQESTRPAWPRAIRTSVATLVRHRIPVLVILPTPDAGVAPSDGDVPACLARRSAQACRFPRAPAVARRRAAADAEIRAVAGLSRARSWDPLPFFCGPRWCRVAAAGVPLYRDGHHLSIAGSRLLVPRLLPVVRATLR